MTGCCTTTKRAVEGICESLQAEVAPFGIRVIAIQAGTILTPIWGKNEAPPEDTAYPQARDFLLTVLTRHLTTSGVPAETVADAIAEVVADADPPLRRLVGDAQGMSDLRENHGDEAVTVFLRSGEDFQRRYAEMSGIDYWS